MENGCPAQDKDKNSVWGVVLQEVPCEMRIKIPNEACRKEPRGKYPV